jgi:chemotaxis signal transduction protein
MEIQLDQLVPTVIDVTASSASLGLLEPVAVASTTEEKLLCFSLHPPELALLPVSAIVEVLRISLGDVLPVPQMPSSILGIYNRRGEMLWLVDLGRLAGYPLSFQAGNAFAVGSVIVLQTAGRSVGLVVANVQDIELHDLQRLQHPSSQLFSQKLLPLVKGYFSESGLMLLDPDAITQALS